MGQGYLMSRGWDKLTGEHLMSRDRGSAPAGGEYLMSRGWDKLAGESLMSRGQGEKMTAFECKEVWTLDRRRRLCACRVRTV